MALFISFLYQIQFHGMTLRSRKETPEFETMTPYAALFVLFKGKLVI